jgi:DNA-binding response OmpR family regulator
VIEADNGSHALDIVEREQAIDLLFTDIVMPGMNGFELGRLAREKRPQLPVLYATGLCGVVHGAGEGADVLAKPYREADLLTKLRVLLTAQDRVGLKPDLQRKQPTLARRAVGRASARLLLLSLYLLRPRRRRHRRQPPGPFAKRPATAVDRCIATPGLAPIAHPTANTLLNLAHCSSLNVVL